MNLDGLLFFPITPFAADGTVDTDLLRQHVDERVAAGAGCVFAGCGTGEFNSLEIDEVDLVARTAVEAAAGRAPVFAGIGGSSSRSTHLIGRLTEHGVRGILLLPPYLVGGSQRGLVEYVKHTARIAPELEIIVYQRGEMIFTPPSVVELSRISNVIGLKDGVGDVAWMQAIVSAVRASGNTDFMFFNGLPTAELSMRAYNAIGVPMYSSAVFAFAPDIALAFFRALQDSDEDALEFLLTAFYIPFAALRDRVPGYAVSLVKSAVQVGHTRAGSVRPPLVDPSPADAGALQELLGSVRRAMSDRMPGAAVPAGAVV